MLLAGLLAALALGLAACDDGGESAEVEEAATPTAQEILDAAAERMEEVESFRFVLEHEGGTSEIVSGIRMERAEGAVAGPERMQADIEAVAGPLSAEVQVVILPDEQFITNPLTGRWQRESLSIEQLFDPRAGATAVMRDVRNPEIVGREEVDGVETYVIEAEVPSESLDTLLREVQPGRTVEAVAWIGVEDPLVYRVELRGAVEESDEPGVVRRITFRDYGAEIEIEPPR